MRIKILLLFLATILVSCSSDGQKVEKLQMYNFGSNIFKEPFQGLFESRPEILVKSLEYPPYSWVSLDTTVLTKRFEVNFNEEAIRSKSIAILNFADTMYRNSENIKIEFNGIDINKGYRIIADSTTKVINAKCTISPAMGDTLFTGYITATGIELDEINDTNLQYENNVLTKWEFEQKIDSPLWLWLLWIISAIILAIIAIVILLVIIKLLMLFVSFISMLCAKIFSFKTSTISRAKVNKTNLSSTKATKRELNEKSKQDKQNDSLDKHEESCKDKPNDDSANKREVSRKNKFPLQLIDIKKEETRQLLDAVVIIITGSSVEMWCQLNLRMINERREKWRLPYYEGLIKKHKGKKVLCKEEFLLLIGWDIKKRPELYIDICTRTLKVIDKMVKIHDGDVEAILISYEEFMYNVDKRAANSHPKFTILHWIRRDQWLEYLSMEAVEYLKEDEDPDSTELFKQYMEAAEHGDVDAQLKLGNLYLNGNGVEQNSVEAFKWFMEAAEQGCAEAQCRIGKMYENGEGIEANTMESFKWYLKAAGQNFPEAQCILGIIYSEGNVVDKNMEEAFKWYVKSAEQGLVFAQNKLAAMYKSGDGVHKNIKEAIKWLNESAQQGSLDAQVYLGEYYFGKNDFTQAMKWLSLAVMSGHTNSTNFIDCSNSDSLGVEANIDKVREIFAKVAKTGNEDAMYNIGECYEMFDKNYTNAIKWYQKALDGGNNGAEDAIERCKKLMQN